MKKALLGIIVVALIIAGFVLVKNNREAPKETDKPTVKIGVVIPLTGKSLTAMGNLQKNLVTYKKEELAQRNTKYNYEFIIEDSQFDSRLTAIVSSKLLNQDKVDAIISVGSRIGNVISPSTERQKTIHLSACASDANVAKGKYNFINWTQPEAEVEKMFEEIKKRNLKNIAIVVANDAATLAMADALEKQLTDVGIENQKISVNPEEIDFRLLITKIERSNPDLYVLLTYEASTMNFIKQAKEQSVDKPITSIETFSFLEDASILEGYWYVDPAEITGEFKEKIEAYNKSDNIFALGNFYDSMGLLIEAFETAPSKDQAVEALTNIKTYNGVIGKLNQDENRIFQSNAIIKKIINGKPVAVEE